MWVVLNSKQSGLYLFMCIMFKVNNKDLRATSYDGVFINNFEQLPYTGLVFPFLTLKQ